MSYLRNFSKPLVASSALALGASIFLLNRSIFNVDGGQKAIIFSRIKGLKRHTYEEGIHFCLPYFEWPIVFNTRTKAYTTSSPTGTKDLQTVNISLRVLYKPNSSKLQKIYRS
ncbi:MAG: Prohibitin-2, subunit of the prohibitin complex (Phb1p-Phb2p), partial [Paramarteilia canceri]